MKCFNYGVGELTSEQIKRHEMLRKAWNAEGSPFKGQPFDPNIVEFQNQRLLQINTYILYVIEINREYLCQ